jgi:hypothetical protein
MESHDSRRDRGSDGRKDRKRERPGKVHADRKPVTASGNNTEELETVPERVDAVKIERNADSKDRHNGRSDRPGRAQNAANDDNRDRRQRNRRDHDDGPTPVGFGDDIPAFMLIVGKA